MNDLIPADRVTPVNGQSLSLPITLGTALSLIDFSDWLWLAHKFGFNREWRMEEFSARQQWLERMRESDQLDALETTLANLSSTTGLPIMRAHVPEPGGPAGHTGTGMKMVKLSNHQKGLALVIPWPKRGRLSMARYRRLAALLGGEIDPQTQLLRGTGEYPGPRLRCVVRINIAPSTTVRKEWVELSHAF